MSRSHKSDSRPIKDQAGSEPWKMRAYVFSQKGKAFFKRYLISKLRRREGKASTRTEQGCDH